ncbi:MAG: Fe-S cluster assembly protein SufD [Acidimicrobiales bacterium]
MTAPSDAEAQVLERAASWHAGRASNEPAWLVGARLDAERWIDVHGFPTKKDEGWRHFPLAPVREQAVAPAPEPSRSDPAAHASSERVAEAVEAASLGLSGARLVFVNGRFFPSLSRNAGLPRGVQVASLASALDGDAEVARAAFLWPGDGPAHAFSALNVARALDGALVRLPAQASISEPIELVYFADPGAAPGTFSTRSLVELGEGSSATLVEVHAGAPEARYLTNAVARVVLGEGADLRRFHLQTESEHASHLSSVEVQQSRGSRLTTSLVALGAKVARHELRVVFGEEDADATLDALYCTSGSQHHDHPVLVEHRAPRCTSRQRYVGIVDGEGHAVFDGHVVVRPGATRTDASQSNKNLLCSERAEVDTRPRLEIFCDDVACAHGAAVGQLDHDALFYLRSRGIPFERARGILVQGFAAQALERVSLGEVRARAARLLAARLGLDVQDPSAMVR